MTRVFSEAAAVALACLVTVSALSAQVSNAAGDRVVMTQDVFKSVTVLRGIPVDTFFDAMGMFANAMGNDCTFCHLPEAALDRAKFADVTPRMQRARQMIAMMQTINKTYFGGAPRVTCFTCHHGNQSPRSDPNIALQYSTPEEDPNARDFTTDPTLSADTIFDKYVQAVGGADRVAKLTSFAAKGTYAGFDTLFEKVPVEIFAKAPNQYTTVVHMRAGNSVRAFNGTNGWMAGPDTAIPLVALTEGNLDRARLEALMAFTAGIPKAYPHWRVGRAVLNDEEVTVIQGINDDRQPIANLYFAPSALLVRLVRWTLTPVGFVPTQIDYSDFRDVAGVKVPFKRVVSQTFMQMTVELTDVQPNVAVDAAKFSRPQPVAGRAGADGR
jgi:Photosynthetic reaction centre cytochrome C subunit